VDKWVAGEVKEFSSSNSQVQTCFHSVKMKIDIETYCATIGAFIAKCTVMQTAASHEVEMTAMLFWFLGLVIMTLLETGKLNSGSTNRTGED
jgi:hypothetical protein